MSLCCPGAPCCDGLCPALLCCAVQSIGSASQIYAVLCWQGADEGAFMQNYQNTLGSSSMQRQQSRNASQGLQQELSTTSSALSDEQDQQLLARQGSHQQRSAASGSPSRQGSSALAAQRQGSMKTMMASSISPRGGNSGSMSLSRQGSSTAATIQQGSSGANALGPSQGTSEAQLYLHQSSVALEEGTELIPAVQMPGSQPASEAGATPIVHAKARRSVNKQNQVAGSGITRGASVADRLKNLRGLMNADVEADSMNRDEDIQEDLPRPEMQGIANIDFAEDSIPEEVQQQS